VDLSEGAGIQFSIGNSRCPDDLEFIAVGLLIDPPDLLFANLTLSGNV
jgi:hypothetical protein